MHYTKVSQSLLFYHNFEANSSNSWPRSRPLQSAHLMKSPPNSRPLTSQYVPGKGVPYPFQRPLVNAQPKDPRVNINSYVQLSRISEAIDLCMRDWPKIKEEKFNIPGVRERVNRNSDGASMRFLRDMLMKIIGEIDALFEGVKMAQELKKEPDGLENMSVGNLIRLTHELQAIEQLSTRLECLFRSYTTEGFEDDRIPAYTCFGMYVF